MNLVIGILVLVFLQSLSAYLIIKRVRGEDGRIDIKKLNSLMLKLMVIISGGVILAWVALMTFLVN